jgi:hypothetical protein
MNQFWIHANCKAFLQTTSWTSTTCFLCYNTIIVALTMKFSLSKLHIEEFILVESKGVSAGWVPPAPRHLWMLRCPCIFGIRLNIKVIAMSKSHIISIGFFRWRQTHFEKITMLYKTRPTVFGSRNPMGALAFASFWVSFFSANYLHIRISRLRKLSDKFYEKSLFSQDRLVFIESK